MITLTIDIGNSSTKLGLFNDRSLIRTERLLEIDEPALDRFVEDDHPGRVVFCSVVPALAERLRAMSGIRALDPLEVTPSVRLPFEMAYQSPETLGADRIAAAAGGVLLHPDSDPLLTIDAGTAVTVEVIRNGRFVGGAIAPGPTLLAQSLESATAQLPLLTPVEAAPAIGTTTMGSLESGVWSMFVGGVQRLIGKVSEELGATPTIVVTGGWAGWVMKTVPRAIHDPDLVLHGLLHIGELNAG